MKSPKTKSSEPRVVQQFALDLGDGAPMSVAINAKTGKALEPMSASARRDKAISEAMDNERKAWRELHDRELAVFLAEKGDIGFIAEDFRRWFMARGNAAPHHHNVWGAMWMNATRHGLLAKTGQYRHMQELRSHARITTEWMRPASVEVV